MPGFALDASPLGVKRHVRRAGVGQKAVAQPQGLREAGNREEGHFMGRYMMIMMLLLYCVCGRVRTREDEARR
jgi:hypothetical protein